MDTPRQSKNHLSKHLLQMKFMQRSALRVQKEDYESEQQKYIDDEHWRRDIPDLAKKESKYILEPSYIFCENLRSGRISFKGFNPEIEKLMVSQDQELDLAEAERKEKEISVGDEEMTQRYSTLVGTVAKKFAKKRHRNEQEEPEEIEDEKVEEQLSVQSQKKWKKDKRPSKNKHDKGNSRYF